MTRHPLSKGTAAGLGDSGAYAARAAAGFMMVSYSTGVNPGQASLTPASVVGALDPGHDRDPEFFAGGPGTAVEDVLLQQREEAICSSVTPGSRLRATRTTSSRNSFGYGLGTATSFQAASQQAARSGVTYSCSSPWFTVIGRRLVGRAHAKRLVLLGHAGRDRTLRDRHVHLRVQRLGRQLCDCPALPGPDLRRGLLGPVGSQRRNRGGRAVRAGHPAPPGGDRYDGALLSGGHA